MCRAEARDKAMQLLNIVWLDTKGRCMKEVKELEELINFLSTAPDDAKDAFEEWEYEKGKYENGKAQ